MPIPNVEDLDEIINDLDPTDLPLEYILLAQVTSLSGQEKILAGQALKELLEGRAEAQEVCLILNFSLMRRTILQWMEDIYDGVDELKQI